MLCGDVIVAGLLVVLEAFGANLLPNGVASRQIFDERRFHLLLPQSLRYDSRRGSKGGSLSSGIFNVSKYSGLTMCTIVC